VIRLNSPSKEKIIELAHQFDQTWLTYDQPELNIISKTHERHNAITPIARKSKKGYHLYIAFRNNRTNEEYPDGIFHPHKEHQPIKKENIGLIEVMGLGVLPGRLEKELKTVLEVLQGTNDLSALSQSMQGWAKNLSLVGAKNMTINDVYQAAMRTFVCGLEDCAVFGHTDQGKAALESFIESTIK
jgi:UDPglucose--hexose-1-phosphate uridylyltransferase